MQNAGAYTDTRKEPYAVNAAKFHAGDCYEAHPPFFKSNSAARTTSATPAIVYVGVAGNYATGTAITPIKPLVKGDLTGNGSYNDVPAMLGAAFNQPGGVAVDAAGNVYVADAAANALKKIAAVTGEVTTVRSGFYYPTGVAVDVDGNVYAVDLSFGVIKIAAADGVVTTLLPALNRPSSVAVDQAGNVYAADYYGNAVLKADAASGKASYIGSGFKAPSALTVDQLGNLYVAESGTGTIKKVDAVSGTVATVATGTNRVLGICVDKLGNIFYTDINHNTVQKIAAGSGVVTNLGSGFSAPRGLAIDRVGNLFVGDYGNNAVKKIVADIYSIRPVLPAGLSMDPVTGIISGTPAIVTPGTTYTVTAQNGSDTLRAFLRFSTPVPAGISYTGASASYPTGAAIEPLSPRVTGNLTGNGTYSSTPVVLEANLMEPVGVAVDRSGNVYVSQYEKNFISKISASDGAVSSIGSDLSNPYGIATDPMGNVYVSDYGHQAVKVIAPDGSVATLVSGDIRPMDLDVDAAGNIYLVDYEHFEVKKVESGTDATLSTLWSGSNEVSAITVDASGNLYMADFGNQSLKVLAAGGTRAATLVAGGIGPQDVAADDLGNIYIADFANKVIRKISGGTGIVTTLETGVTAPYAIAVDSMGNLYVTDFEDHSVKKIQANIYSVAPALPAGLRLDPLTGLISGTPTVVTPVTTYTVSAHSGGAIAKATLRFATTAALSVHWIKFSGKLRQPQGTLLSWQVAEERVAGFDIQSSDNGQAFISVGKLASKGSGIHTYRFTDPRPFHRNRVYRIAQIALDGTLSYSPALSLYAGQPAAVRVFPNPVRNSMTITLPDRLVGSEALLYTINGSPVRRLFLREPRSRISLNGLAAGVYVLRFKDGSSQQIIKK